MTMNPGEVIPGGNGGGGAATTLLSAPPAPSLRRHLRLLEVIRRLASTPEGAVGLVLCTAMVAMVCFAGWLAPQSPFRLDLAHQLGDPSRHHLFGLDQLGRDQLSRLIFGARIALGVALPAVGGALLGGLLLGLIAGYAGKWVDHGLVVVVDTIQAFPGLVLALALIALVGPSTTTLIVVLMVAFMPAYARVTRSLALTLKGSMFVDAERVLGATSPRILFRHVVPNLLPSLLILLAMDIPSAIAAEAGLSFLGLGTVPPNPSWGNMLADGFRTVRDTPWPVVVPAGAIMLATLGFTLLAESLRDVLDPKFDPGRRS